MARPVPHWVLSAHAEREIARRGIEKAIVAQVLANPEQRLPVRPGREVLQSRMVRDGKTCLVRVFVDFDRDPPTIVTAYSTSKIGKYWSPSP
jgi:Domain of unknown function (DUF4258)